MDKYVPHELNIPDLEIKGEEPKESFVVFPKFTGFKLTGFEFKMTLWFNSFKDLFRKRF